MKYWSSENFAARAANARTDAALYRSEASRFASAGNDGLAEMWNALSARAEARAERHAAQAARLTERTYLIQVRFDNDPYHYVAVVEARGFNWSHAAQRVATEIGAGELCESEHGSLYDSSGECSHGLGVAGNCTFEWNRYEPA